MKSTFITFAASLLSIASSAPLEERASGIQGFDISGYQTVPDYASAYASGARFVIIKATEGTTYKSPEFSAQYDGATKNKFIRGAYHFAQPASSSGKTQADYFFSHGGGWSNDGITLPGMLDIEYGPSSSPCYGLSTTAMVAFISDFVNEYHSKSSRWPIIYTSDGFWNQCTGGSTKFSGTCPLNIAHYASSPKPIPGGWPYQTFWQYADSYKYGGDADTFNGDLASLKKLATG